MHIFFVKSYCFAAIVKHIGLLDSMVVNTLQKPTKTTWKTVTLSLYKMKEKRK
jgi:hypothetical protein